MTAAEIVGHETLTVSNSAVGFTIPASNVTHVIVRVNDNNIRWRADGTDPTASAGKTQEPGDEFSLSRESEISQFKAIRETSSDGELDIIYLTGKP